MQPNWLFKVFIGLDHIELKQFTLSIEKKIMNISKVMIPSTSQHILQI